MIRKIIATAVLVAVVAAGGLLAYQATSRSGHSSDGKLQVAASYYPLYDFARQVGGDKVIVVNMTPPGAEPHDYDPSPQALIAAHNSAVFIYNGGPFEPWVDSLLADYRHTTVKASQGITLLGNDPHFWLDPLLAQHIIDNIRDGLSRADPEHKDYYAANAERYNEKLAELDKHFSEGLSSCRLDIAISSHGAFSYLAQRYGFSVISIAGIEPDDEPSPARMAELTTVVKQKNIPYIFFESLVSPRPAETIARETGAGTLVFDPIEGLSQEDQAKGKDYISVQYDNLGNLRKALDCK